jgi:hypothetical protein
MPKKTKRHSKDFAAKNTLNPPQGGKPAAAPGVREEQPADREVGQYTGRGTPPLQKK